MIKAFHALRSHHTVNNHPSRTCAINRSYTPQPFFLNQCRTFILRSDVCFEESISSARKLRFFCGHPSFVIADSFATSGVVDEPMQLRSQSRMYSSQSSPEVQGEVCHNWSTRVGAYRQMSFPVLYARLAISLCIH